MKKNQKQNDSPTRDQYTVVLERLESKVDLLVEGHRTLNEKIEREVGAVNQKIDGLTQESQGMTAAFLDLNKEVKNFKAEFVDFRKETRDNFKLVFSHFSNLEDDLDQLRADVNELKQDMGKKATTAELASLERRLKKLEAAFSLFKKAAQ